MKKDKTNVGSRTAITAMIILLLTITVACSKTEAPTPDEEKTGQFSIEFDNIMGEETLSFEPRVYKNAKGESFRIKLLQYFISNIKLYKADGSSYTVPQDDSYFLVNAADRTTRFTKVKVPEGNYEKVEFVIGVDSLRNTMPVEKRTGVLSFNPEEGHEGGGMYWGWNSGYIFFKMEGYCDLISDNQQGDPTGNKQFKYHIGGFGGYNAPTLNNIKTITVDLKTAGTAQVREGLRSNVHLFVDIMKIFNGPHTFSIVEHPNVMFSEYSVNIANNFPHFFTHDHTENFVKSEDEL
ncbi:MbnP family protein [Sphingobacterium kitahiroshimense]|uniref:MbnP family protein n=1 Tax=Sphingobacterium kitahiroshimense TaxID=470446 RepID=A0ABV0BZ11_9SPHI